MRLKKRTKLKKKGKEKKKDLTQSALLEMSGKLVLIGLAVLLLQDTQAGLEHCGRTLSDKEPSPSYSPPSTGGRTVNRSGPYFLPSHPVDHLYATGARNAEVTRLKFREFDKQRKLVITTLCPSGNRQAGNFRNEFSREVMKPRCCESQELRKVAQEMGLELDHEGAEQLTVNLRRRLMEML